MKGASMLPSVVFSYVLMNCSFHLYLAAWRGWGELFRNGLRTYMFDNSNGANAWAILSISTWTLHRIVMRSRCGTCSLSSLKHAWSAESEPHFPQVNSVDFRTRKVSTGCCELYRCCSLATAVYLRFILNVTLQPYCSPKHFHYKYPLLLQFVIILRAVQIL